MAALLLLIVSLASAHKITEQAQTYTYSEPIDALSVGVETDKIDLAISALIDGQWVNYKPLELEKEFDPALRESNLIVFPRPVTAVRVRGTTERYTLHPLRVSQEPPSYLVAARSRTAPPRILSRQQWRANDDWLFNGNRTNRSDIEAVESNAFSLSDRSKECDQFKEQYPGQFHVTKTVTHDEEGREYRWTKQYSSEMKLLVVHHTAQNLDGDERTPWERMRLLYQYHANSRGWGDVGYHYVIDETGQIYEGRHGGKYVVGGHAYCSNIGTLGVALMGNFEVEKPTQQQMKSLQWLLKELADDYGVNLTKKVSYHGKSLQPIVGHRELSPTSCPGFYVNDTLSQVRRNVQRGEVYRSVRFPRGPGREIRDFGTPWYLKTKKVSLSPVGSTDITGRPGSQARVSLLLRAGDLPLNRRDRVANVVRSDNRIDVWQEIEADREMRVRQEIILPRSLDKGEAMTIRLRIKLPREPAIYTLQIGDVPYVITAKGRRIGDSKDAPVKRKLSPSYRSSGNPDRLSLVRLPPAKPVAKAPNPIWEPDSTNIRIRLSFPHDTATLNVGKATFVNGKQSNRHRLDLRREGDDCVAAEYGIELGRGTVRIVSGDGVAEIRNWQTSSNRFRGVLECQIVDGALALINELPLEDYLAGLAEEPDSEPYEKQRAFAVAARSYAAHYMDPNNRKFPGKPYDGNDSPASFQKYGGVRFEEANPRWVEAVKSTAGIVVKKDGHVVKTPYFSSDSGRTKSPREAGWNRFPFAEVFSSKQDPWCEGMQERGHGVGMSGCGAKGQALEGKSAEEILEYYYPSTELVPFVQ